jgi:hypothetical protein
MNQQQPTSRTKNTAPPTTTPIRVFDVNPDDEEPFAVGPLPMALGATVSDTIDCIWDASEVGRGSSTLVVSVGVAGVLGAAWDGAAVDEAGTFVVGGDAEGETEEVVAGGVVEGEGATLAVGLGVVAAGVVAEVVVGGLMTAPGVVTADFADDEATAVAAGPRSSARTALWARMLRRLTSGDDTVIVLYSYVSQGVWRASRQVRK